MNTDGDTTALYYRCAGDVARSIGAGEVSARDVLTSTLARIDELNPRVNAISDLARDDVLSAADDADESGGDGVLRGVPITVKDALDVAGRATTWGNLDWARSHASRDAVVVGRLRTAGAVVIGKTNVALMLADFGQTANPLHGRTNNPWDLERSAGGSSGGAAAAVACGMSYLDYGSDLAGSVRIPAAFTGVYGLKPTAGIVPLDGFQPPGPPAAATPLDDLAYLGPIARTAGDVRLALRATVGASGAATNAWRYTVPEPRRRRLGDFRVGVVLDSPGAAPNADVGAVLGTVVDDLARAGAHLREGWPDGFDPAANGEAFGYLVGAYLAFKQGDAGAGPDLRKLVEVDAVRSRMRVAWDDYFADLDVLVCPTTVSTAPPHDDRPMAERTVPAGDGRRAYGHLAGWVAPASVSGLPALSAPVGLASGLPVGLQIIGPRHEDDTVITFAEQLAEIAGIEGRPIA